MRRPKLRDDVRRLDDEDYAVIHDIKTDRVHLLNETAAFVTRLCDGKHSETQIAEALREVYTEAPSLDKGIRDVRSVVEQLSNEGLVIFEASEEA